MTGNALGMEELAHTNADAAKALFAVAGEVNSPLPPRAAPNDVAEVAHIAPCGSRVRERKNWADSMDLPLLKDMVANKVYLSGYGRTRERFDAVAASLNKVGALPWETNGNHCRDRWSLITRTWQRRDKAFASSTGLEEYITERYFILYNPVEERDVFDEGMEEKRRREVQRVESFLRAGEELISLALRARGGAVSNEAAEDVVVASESRACGRMRDDGYASACVGVGSIRIIKTDVYASLLELEHNKVEQAAEEKAAEYAFRMSQMNTVERIASALDQQKTLELQNKML